jgi:hypothetical protein
MIGRRGFKVLIQNNTTIKSLPLYNYLKNRDIPYRSDDKKTRKAIKWPKETDGRPPVFPQRDLLIIFNEHSYVLDQRMSLLNKLDLLGGISQPKSEDLIMNLEPIYNDYDDMDTELESIAETYIETGSNIPNVEVMNPLELILDDQIHLFKAVPIPSLYLHIDLLLLQFTGYDMGSKLLSDNIYQFADILAQTSTLKILEISNVSMGEELAQSLSKNVIKRQKRRYDNEKKQNEYY